ncbi:MAG: hypothetical protein Q9160_000428 [Pyrenula sp. 1 TL-2023]
MYVNNRDRKLQDGQTSSHPTKNQSIPSASTLPSTPLTQPQSPQTPTPSSLLASLRQDGFVLIPSLLNPTEISTLLSAARSVTDLASSGSWPHIRTVPKQFPPWPPSPTPAGIWGVQHLLHPSIPHRRAFASTYFHSKLLSRICALLSIPNPDSLVMELFNLLVSPTGFDSFSLTWHRDDIRPDLSPEAEAAELAAKSPLQPLHAQYNIALTPDDSLVVIPGSHRRVRTDEERSADPYAEHLTGQITVKLNPGDAVFYDSNILHRGVYKAKKRRPSPSVDPSDRNGEAANSDIKTNGNHLTPDDGDGDDTADRYTLHGSVGLVGHGAERARQVLQHAVGEWIEREDAGFKGLGLRLDSDSAADSDSDSDENADLTNDVEEVAEGMRARLIAMGRSGGENGAGYSLEG